MQIKNTYYVSDGLSRVIGAHPLKLGGQFSVRGTRVGQGPDYGENTADKSVANSSYNALETTLRYQHGGSQFMLSYAYAKSIDQGSNIVSNSIRPTRNRAAPISAWDQKHAFVASYTLELPVERAFSRSNRLTGQRRE